MKYIFTFLLSVCMLAGFAQTKSLKRGLSYGHHSVQDLNVLSAGVSWYYNWYHQPEEAVINQYEDYDFDFVPMAWNGAFNKQALREFLLTHPNVKYILGWNEPNFLEQANMTPSQAAALWPDIEDLADEFGLEIVSPAVNYCGGCVQENGVTYTDPIQYLDDFFEACEGCRVDHIAIHCYMANVGALQWYVGLFKKYDKPIWLTEFAAWEGAVTLEQQKSFMIGAVDYLENDPDVFRYAWFTGRHTGAPYIGVLSDNEFGQLTDLGKIYVNMRQHDPNVYTAIPARIEAENYNTMSGIMLEATQDVDGMANVGYIDASDWIAYNIDVPEDGTYLLYARLASSRAASFQVLDGVNLLTTFEVPNTGGYQNWKTYRVVLNLTAGEHTITLKTSNGGFNINWIDFRDDRILSNEEGLENSVQISPNPTNATISIDAPARWTKMELSSMVGVKHYQGKMLQSLNLQSLSAGTYLLRFADERGNVICKKVMKY